MLWKKQLEMRITWTFRTYSRSSEHDRAEGSGTEDVVDPQFIRCPQTSQQKLPSETVGNEDTDEITSQHGI